jgi:hypothetical protein
MCKDYIAVIFKRFASPCCGFTNTFHVSGTSTLGTCNGKERPSLKRLIPFDTFNLFYRDDLELSRLAPLRQAAIAAL